MFRANQARSGQADLFNIFEEAFTAFATINTDLPIERQILGGLATSVQAISRFIPEDREVTPRVTQLLQTADAIAVVAGNEGLDLEHRILLGIGQGLQGIGGVTPSRDMSSSQNFYRPTRQLRTTLMALTFYQAP